MKSIKYLFLALAVMLASVAWAPLSAPTKPALKYPISNTVVAIDVAADTVTLKWSKSTVGTSYNLQGYDWEISEYSTVDTSGSFASNPNYGKFSYALVDSGSVSPSAVGDPLYPVESVVIPANTFEYGKKYYWHVRAEDDSTTQYSYWSSTGYFRVGVQAPALGNLTFPYPDGLENGDTLRPTFYWTPRDDTDAANGYTIEISTQPGFETRYLSASISATALTKYTPLADLPLVNTDYYWRVRANNTVKGVSAWTVGTFKSAMPPTKPVLKSPANNTLQMDVTPEFIWTPSVARGSSVFDHYTLQIFTENPNTNPAATAIEFDDTDGVPVIPNAGTSTVPLVLFTIPDADALNPAITYYWRVLAYSDNGDYSISTSVFTFRTGIVGKVAAGTMDPGYDWQDTTDPAGFGNVPGLTDPLGYTPSKPILGYAGAQGDNINLLTLRPTFAWDPGLLDAQSFVLQIASAASGSCDPTNPNASSFASKILTVNVSSSKSSYTPTTNLPANQVLCWRLQPYHPTYAPSGKGLWSDVQLFRTANPPSIPTPLAPLNGTLTNDNSPGLKWSKPILPSGEVFGKYEVEISRFSDFSGYTYDNSVAPYVIRPITYPLPDPAVPMSPADALAEPILPNVVTRAIPLYDTLFGLYPQMIHAHGTQEFLADGTADPNYEVVNDHDEPWFQIHEDVDSGAPPAYGPLYGAATYYWRVRAYNKNGEYSPWSSTFSVRVSPDRPENVTVTTSTPATLRPVVKWDPVINAYNGLANQYYKVVFYKTMGTTTLGDDRVVYASVYVPGFEYTPPVDLPKDTEMYARVYAWSVTYGLGLYGKSLEFTTTIPPLAPSGLVTPASGSLVQTTRPPAAQKYEPTFRWSLPAIDITPAGDNFDDFEIQLSESDPNFTAPITISTGAIGELDTTFTLDPAATPLNPLKVYYWRVRSCTTGPDACSAWSKVASFKTAILAPEGLTEDTTDPLRPVLEWDPVYGAAKYRVYLRQSATSCSSTGVLVKTNFYQVPYYLTAGKDYSWCVVAYDGFGFSYSVMSELKNYVP